MKEYVSAELSIVGLDGTHFNSAYATVYRKPSNPSHVVVHYQSVSKRLVEAVTLHMNNVELIKLEEGLVSPVDEAKIEQLKWEGDGRQ